MKKMISMVVTLILGASLQSWGASYHMAEIQSMIPSPMGTDQTLAVVIYKRHCDEKLIRIMKTEVKGESRPKWILGVLVKKEGAPCTEAARAEVTQALLDGAGILLEAIQPAASTAQPTPKPDPEPQPEPDPVPPPTPTPNPEPTPDPTPIPDPGPTPNPGPQPNPGDSVFLQPDPIKDEMVMDMTCSNNDYWREQPKQYSVSVWWNFAQNKGEAKVLDYDSISVLKIDLNQRAIGAKTLEYKGADFSLKIDVDQKKPLPQGGFKKNMVIAQIQSPAMEGTVKTDCTLTYALQHGRPAPGIDVNDDWGLGL